MVGDAGNERQPSIPDDLASIEAHLAATGALMLVIDPLMAYLGGDVNSHRDQDVRRALAPLAAMADRLRVAVLVIRHLNKSSGGPAIYRGGGSIGLAGAARIVLAVGTDPEDETRRVLAPVKANLSAPSPSLAYRLVEAPGAVRIEWLGASRVTAGQPLAVPADEDERSALDAATDFLSERLADGQPVEVKPLLREARDAGHSDKTIRRAAKRLGVNTHDRAGFGPGFPSRWSLHGQEIPTSPSKTNGQVGETWASRESSDVVTRTLPEGMRHSACPRCGAVATVLAAAADSLCAGCMPITPRVTRRWPQPASAGG